MERILLFLEDPETRRQVQEVLAGGYRVAAATGPAALKKPYDLAIVDLPALHRIEAALLARKKMAEPRLAPILLVALPQELGGTAAAAPVDELLCLPLEPRELRLRVENLLRVGRLAVELETQRRQLEEERLRLEAILQTSPEAIVVADAQGRIILTNPVADRLYPYPLPRGEDFRSFAALHLCHPDGSAYDLRELPLTRAALDGETSRQMELAIVWPDGRRRDLLVNCSPLRDREGGLNGAVGIFQDISEQKAAELEKWQLFCQMRDYAETAQLANQESQEQTAELETQAAELENQTAELEAQSEEMETHNEELRVQKEELERLAAELHTEREYLKTVLEQMPAGVVIAEAASGSILLGNRRAQEIWRRPISPHTDLLEFCRYPRFHADGRPYRASEVPLMRSLLQGEVILDEEIATVHEDGSQAFLSVSAVPVKDPRGKILAGVVIFSDVTAKKRAEQEIAHLASFPQLNPNPVLEMDLSGRLTYVNPAAVALLQQNGYSPDEATRFVPEDWPEISAALSQKAEPAVYREIELGEQVFGVTLHLAEPFGGLRLYGLNITARKKIETELRRAKEEWERTFDAVPDLITIMDEDHHMVRCNRAMAAALGQEPDQLVGRLCYEVFHRTSAPPPLCPHTQLLNDGQGHSMEVRELGRDFQVTTSPLKDAEGRALGSVHVARDITVNKRAEAALRESEARFKAVFEGAAIGIALKDLEGRYLQSNNAFLEMLGYTQEELQGKTFGEITHPDSHQPDLEAYQELMSGRREHCRLEKRYIRKDGKILWGNMSVSLVRDDQGLPQFFISMVENVTERKQAEEAIRRQAELLDLARDAIFVRDLQDRIVYWNRGAEEIYGWTREEALGKNTHLFLKTEFPKPLKEVEEDLLKTGYWEGEVAHHTRDGRRLVMAGRLALHRDEPGKPARILEICTDITARKQAEEALQRAYEELELRVEKRTADLKFTVEQLQEEVIERQRAEKQAKSLGRLYRLLSQVDEAIVRAPDQDTLFNQVCRIAVEAGLFRMAWVGLKDPDGAAVRAVARYGVDEGYLEALVIPLEDAPESRGPTGIALQEGRFDVCNDLASDPRMAPWRERALARGYRSSGAFPLWVGGQVVGALNLYAGKTGFFNEEEIALLESLSSDLSFAMEAMDREARRRRAEEALRDSEARFVQFMQHLPGPALMRDAQGRYLFVNESWEEFFNLKSSEVLGKTVEEVWPPNAAQRFRQLDRVVLLEKKSIQAVENYPARKGERFFLVNRFPILDAEGRVVMLGGIGTDITPRQRAEEALREKTRLLDAFFEHALTPQVFLDKDFNFMRVNQAYAMACQRQPGDFPGHNHFEFFPHEENQAIFAAVVRTKVPYEAVAKAFVFPDHPEWGVTYWDWTLAPILDEAGEVDFLVFSLKDVTERVRAEEARSQLLEILDATPDFMGTADASGKALFLNRAGRRLLGLGVEEDISQINIVEKHPEWVADLILHEGFPTAVRNGSWQAETVLLGAGGREIPLSQVILAHKGPQGEVKFFSTIGRDISDLKLAEEALKKSEQKLRLLATQILKVQERERGRLSRELHDGLGQALLVFKLQLRAIQRQLPEECGDLGKDCVYALQYMDEIIEDVRRLSHNLSPTVLEDIGLTAAIKSLCDEFRRTHDLEVIMELDEVADLFPLDLQIDIYRIFQEALTNISKHADASRIYLAIKQRDGEITFVIEDNGVGFNLEKVLNREALDRGLGLAAMFERVRSLGGDLEIVKLEGQGTRIAFRVPLEGVD